MNEKRKLIVGQKHNDDQELQRTTTASPHLVSREQHKAGRSRPVVGSGPLSLCPTLRWEFLRTARASHAPQLSSRCCLLAVRGGCGTNAQCGR